ncbi:T9SS type A sorting domain-containing protein [Hymenobacter weizhouensis]|uniref:T9SS type A sorting domain-containing protein n=1 Tax=Hymenobacter sp. YIM 151500-1 TaxID=2987689 RepID=UPI0022277742|nr:T9SS type A sorting domain-containing protein [Hymenobacter sp. YIM 151500-1]UYZ63703.1 T9SS type A sorting domain-containing protein [Hymenobacter sp. YIM 151500-1]
MKHLLPLLCCAASLLCAARTASAQVPTNGNFETWQQSGPGENPQGWFSADDYWVRAASAPNDLGLVDKSTERQGGSFAVRLQAKGINTTQGPRWFRGFMVLGEKLNFNNFLAKGGQAYTNRPAAMQFWYKLATAAGDSSIVYAELTRGSGSTRQVIGYSAQVLDYRYDRTTYGQATVPFLYNPNLPATLEPDTLRMYVTVGYGRRVAITSTSTLFLDDLALLNTTTPTTKPALAAALSVYPNPSSSGEFSLASAADPALATAPLTVTDAAGRLVLRQGAASRGLSTGRPVDLRGHGPGLYLLQLDTPQGPVTRKLVIH